MLPKMPVEFTFDPDKSTDDEFRELWSIDPVGRIFFVLWRPCHLISNLWYQAAIRIARRIEKLRPTTPEALTKCLTVEVIGSFDFSLHDCKAFADDALPYFTGELAASWKGAAEGSARVDQPSVQQPQTP